VLWIRDVYPGSEFFPFRNPDPNFSIPAWGSASKNLGILAQKNDFQALGNMILVVHPGSRSATLTSVLKKMLPHPFISAFKLFFIKCKPFKKSD
jgi:hypothetical protein